MLKLILIQIICSQLKLPQNYLKGLQDESNLLLESRVFVEEIENVIKVQREAAVSRRVEVKTRH